MMQFFYNDYRFRFKRVPNQHGHKVDTVCSVLLGDRNGGLVCEATAYLHPRDVARFNKEIGRRVALSKAICGFEREKRLAVFAEYERALAGQKTEASI